MSTKAKNSSILVVEGTVSDKKSICVNRYKVQFEGPFAIVSLAFAQGGFTLGSSVVVVPITALAASKASVLDYLDRVRPKIGDAEADKPTDINLSQQPVVHYGNHIGFAHIGQLAQIRLMSFDLKDIATPGTKEVKAERVVTFEMPTTTQLGVITALYVR